MSKKSISINPNFLKIGKAGKTPKEKKPRKQRPINTLKPNNVKKKLIEKIKAHQQREKQKEILNEEKEILTQKKEILNKKKEFKKKNKKIINRNYLLLKN